MTERFIMMLDVEPADLEDEEERDQLKWAVFDGLSSRDVENGVQEVLNDWYGPVNEVSIVNTDFREPVWRCYVEVRGRKGYRWDVRAETAEKARIRLPAVSGLTLGADWYVYRTRRLPDWHI